MTNIGIIGVGKFGQNYIRVVNEIESATLVGVSSRTHKTLDSLVLDNSVIKTTNPNDLIRNEQVDALIIATPAKTHADLIERALKSGKHILVEKPAFIDLKKTAKIERVLNRSDRVFMTAHQFVYNDFIRYLKSSIDSEELDPIRSITAEHRYPGPIRQDIGCFWDAATHQLSVAKYLFNPGEIKRIGTHYLHGISGYNRETFVDADLEFQNGIKMSILVDSANTTKVRKFFFFSDNSKAVYDDPTKNLTYYSQKIGIRRIEIEPREPLRNEVEHFIDCIANKKKPLTGFESTYEITRWLDQISREIRIPGYK